MSNGNIRKPIVFVSEGVKTPPFSRAGRRAVGELLSDIQDGMTIGMPASRPMPSIGRGIAELRVDDVNRSFRVVYRVDADAVLVLCVFEKRGQKTPKRVIDLCKRRLKLYDA